MSLQIVGVAFVLGVSSSPHCVAMCGPICGALAGDRAGTAADAAVDEPARATIHGCARNGSPMPAIAWQIGRACGYALAGAVAALLGASGVWLSTRIPGLKFLWVFAHAIALVWGLALLARGRPPALALWLSEAARGRMGGRASRPAWMFGIGLGWALMPCGLLYTALMLAVICATPWLGAMLMLAFALGSGLVLGALMEIWRRARRAGWTDASVLVFRRHGRAPRSWTAIFRNETFANRVAGALLTGMASWALWAVVTQGPGAWCA